MTRLLSLIILASLPSGPVLATSGPDELSLSVESSEVRSDMPMAEKGSTVEDSGLIGESEQVDAPDLLEESGLVEAPMFPEETGSSVGPGAREPQSDQEDETGEGGASLVRFSLGAEGMLLFRQEAGGTRTVMPTLAPRIAFRVDEHVGIAVSYGFFRAVSGIGIGDVTERLHRVMVRAEYSLPVKAAAFVFALGGAASVHHTSFPVSAKGEAVRDPISVRPGVVAGFALDVNVPVSTSLSWFSRWVVLRAGVDTLWSGARWDLSTVVGVSVPVGGA